MRKGFTLIELLAVIVILAIILVIAVPKIIDVISNVKINAYISNEKMVEKAASLYLSTNVDRLPAEIGYTTEIKVNDLISASYLKSISDPDNKNSTCNGYVLVTKINDSEYDYTPHIKCGSSNTITTALQDGLVAYWKLDGNALDYSMNSNDGTINESTATQNRFGENNKAMNFDGINDYIDLNYGYALDPTTNPHSFCLWIKANRIDSPIMFMSSGQLGGSNNRFYLGIQASRWDMGIITSGWGGSPTVATTDWTFVTIVLNGTTAKLYINGTNIYNKSYTSYLFNRDIYLGSHDNNTYWWNGQIDDVRIYNRALTDSEIKYMYSTEKIN